MTATTNHKPLTMMILAPKQAVVPRAFGNSWRDSELHGELLADMQRMRGQVALEEGAISTSDLDSDGRHRMAGDESSWHLIRVSDHGKVKGCARILVHPESANFAALRLSSSAVARNPLWKKQVRWTVEADMAVARKKALNVVEPGGWVLDEQLRGTSEAISIALSAFAWSQLFGDCLAYVTATAKHGSASMLKRLGGDSLYFGGGKIPKYYDPAYNCEMEIVKLQTKGVNPKFEALLAPLRKALSRAVVLQAETEPNIMNQTQLVA